MAKRNYSCALITGASNGIGRALARELAFRSDRLVLVARREELLRDVALELGKFCRVDFFAVDLADEHSLQKFLQALEAASIVPDLLVNNAGFGVYGSFLDTDSSRENEMVRLNIQALMVLSKWFVTAARRCGVRDAFILNVASVAGFVPGPFMAVYFATKAFVLSFSEALDQELKGSGIRVLALCPGNTRSEFHHVAGSDRSRWMHRLSQMEAKQVARAAIRQLEHGDTVYVPGVLNRLSIGLVRLFPRAWVRAVMALVLR